MKRHAPAAARNRDPILEVLRQILPERGVVLEVASGSGEHAAYFARHLPQLDWQPSDIDDAAVQSIAAHRGEAALGNLRAPIQLDVRDDDWGPEAIDIGAVLCINMIHIAPWRCCEALIDGAAARLGSGAPLVLYGPYRFGGVYTAPSNEQFDASLRQRDPNWGVRDVDDLERYANGSELDFETKFALPANNHVLVFRRR